MSNLSEQIKQNNATAFTHSGKFHADDVFSSALLLYLNPEIRIIRGNKVPEDFDGIVFDIGRGRYDHHQKDSRIRENGIPYAAFGLLWEELGVEILGEELAQKFDESFVQPLDNNDNTGEKNPVPPDKSCHPERVREILKISQEPVSLETPIGEEEDSHLGDFIQDDNVPVPADAAAFTLLKEQLVEVLSTLTDREQKVLRLRFGLDDGRARTLEEVGKEFNVTRERIRQIEAKALRKLRHPSRSRKLKDYLD